MFDISSMDASWALEVAPPSEESPATLVTSRLASKLAPEAQRRPTKRPHLRKAHYGRPNRRPNCAREKNCFCDCYLFSFAQSLGSTRAGYFTLHQIHVHFQRGQRKRKCCMDFCRRPEGWTELVAKHILTSWDLAFTQVVKNCRLGSQLDISGKSKSTTCTRTENHGAENRCYHRCTLP